MTSELVSQTSDMGQVPAGPEGDFLRRALVRLLHQAMEAEASAQMGAGLHKRSEDRARWRNGFRPRAREIGVGPMMLEIPSFGRGPNSRASSRRAKARSGRCWRSCRRRTCTA